MLPRPDLPLCGQILRLAAPLILSTTGLLLMQFTDGIFLSWYSAEAIAAVGAAGMASFFFSSLIMGATGYTTVLTAQYAGAGQPERIGSAVWQGAYLGLGAGFLGYALIPVGALLFRFVNHAPAVQQYEVQYFSIMCLGMPVALVGSALSGFFIGRGDNRVVMIIQLLGFTLNAGLAYGLIFGRLGLPAWGVAGSAWATVVAQAAVAAALAWAFLRREHRAGFGTWSGRRWDPEMLLRLVRFGLPNGCRFGMEIFAWTVFLFFVGRIGTTELAATNIAWRINGLAFFPIIGLSEAIRMLVGQAQGRGDPTASVRITVQGLLVAEAWMLAAALTFILFPREYFALFRGSGAEAAAAFVAEADLGVVLLRFVAVYCLLDSFNIVLTGALQAAGDTRWTLIASILMHALFLGMLWTCDLLHLSVYVEWTIATVFVLAIALVWVFRFRTDAWKQIQVIEGRGAADMAA